MIEKFRKKTPISTFRKIKLKYTNKTTLYTLLRKTKNLTKKT